MNINVGSGKLIKIIGQVLIAVPACLYLLDLGEILAHKIPILTETIILFSAIPIFILGVFFYWRGRQIINKSCSGKILTDSKPDILYLRKFSTDPSFLNHIISLFNIVSRYGTLETEEEQLAAALKPIGDLVAIGQPGEKLPLPGAARLYASDDEWKNVVVEQMRSAKLVILRAGVAEGLLWEIKQAFDICSPNKFLILALKMKKKDYEIFCNNISSISGMSFPEFESIKKFRRVSGFVRFSEEWISEFLPLKAPFWSQKYRKLMRQFQFTLKPVFLDLGVEYSEPEFSISSYLGIK